ncbi:MAG: T9SS type A sorting domain-containing protein [Paludibacter sp.]
MRKFLSKMMLLLILSSTSFLNVSGQNNPIFKDVAKVFPENPSPTDSVYMVYAYESNDGCPDYFLVKDSVVKNRVYVTKLSILGQGRVCTQVVSQFKATLNLGTFAEYTEFYLDSVLVASINVSPSCIMNQYGKVISVTEKSSIIQEENSEDMYEIKDEVLEIGTQVKFKGTKIQCITTPCYNIVDCYTIVDINECVMDKKGVVVAGKDECEGQLFIMEYSPISSAQQLFLIQNMDSAVTNGGNETDSITNGAGTIMPYTNGLNVGDEVIFGGYYTKQKIDSASSCRFVGVATCYEVTNSVPECVMDKKGVVVAGKNNCENQLFIKELTPYLSTPRLYAFVPEGVISDDGSFTSTIKEGDKVIFGSVSFNLDSIFIGLKDTIYMPPMQDCAIAGFATCYEIVESQPVENYSISGKAIAGNDVVQSGSAVLYAKDFKKALNAVPLKSNGTFVFDNLIQGEYTVYIIPDIVQYKNYLPTFYVNKVHYKRADYVSLEKTIDGMSIQLRPFNRPVGNGKIYGNIFYESTGLKDTVMSENGMKKVKVNTEVNFAINIPVLLYDANDEPVDWTLTDENGNYAFENIAIDTYKVVSETAAAEAEIPVVLSVENAVINADLMLKNSANNTDIRTQQNTVLNIYPNPVIDNLTIALHEAGEVSICNAMGQTILKQQLNSGTNTLDLRILSKGVFFVKIGTTTSKLIKK